MQKRIVASLLLIGAMSCAMKKETSDIDTRTPMDDSWFTRQHDYTKANEMADKRKWELAEGRYEELLYYDKGTPYDQKMAQLNKASAEFAQGKASQEWIAFDTFGESDKNRLPSGQTTLSPGGRLLVKTDQIGIGDIFHFLRAAGELKKKTILPVTLSVKGFLHKALEGAAKAYNLTLEKPDVVTSQDTLTTHLVSLLGHLRMTPRELAPEKVVLTTSDQAMGKITDAIAPYQKLNKKIAVVFLGENREAIVMGGRRLRRRHLDANAFEQLLQKYPELIVMDCNTKSNRISFDAQERDDHTTMSSKFSGRVIQIPDEDDAFDTIIAMGLVANKMGNGYVGFGADNGPTNVFTRALSIDAQQRTALIIPDSDSSDMRMEGSGSAYRQLLSDCWVYRCNKPDEQSEIIMGAYEDMTEE